MKKSFLLVGACLFMLFPVKTGIAGANTLPVPYINVTNSAELSAQVLERDYTDNTVIIGLYVEPNSQSINAVGAQFNFSASDMQIEEIITGDSFCRFFLENEYNNINGSAKILCGLPSPGITQKSLIAKVKFQQLNSNIKIIMYDSSSIVLANNGYGTNILSDLIHLYFIY